jgi:arylsulfatase A-like enzyme
VTRDQLVGNIDLSPTIRKLAGLSWRDHTDGVPLQDVAARQHAYARRPILFERARIEGRPWIVARTSRYALFRYKAGTRQGPTELFDLKRDPGELHNVARDPRYARVLPAMIRVANRLHYCRGDLCRDPARGIPAPRR